MGRSQTNGQFIDHGNAPEYFACGLHSVETLGPVCRFVLYIERQMPNGQMAREVPFTCVMPIEAVGSAIALTLRTLGSRIAMPAMNVVTRAISLLH